MGAEIGFTLCERAQPEEVVTRTPEEQWQQEQRCPMTQQIVQQMMQQVMQQMMQHANLTSNCMVDRSDVSTRPGIQLNESLVRGQAMCIELTWSWRQRRHRPHSRQIMGH